MSQLVSYAAHIVEEVGPRPAASDGEHEASKMIQEWFEGLGLETNAEEFNSPTAGNWVRALYYLVAALAAALFFFSPGLGIVALIAAALALVMLVGDLLGKNPLFNLAGRGASQNIVARYVPDGEYDRRRKIIVVAHYDVGRTQLQGLKALSTYHLIVRKVIRIAVLVVFMAILAGVFPLPDIVRQILAVIALIAGAVSVIAALLQVINNFMPYSAGANSNASGVAALFGVAERLLGGAGAASGRAPSGLGASRGAVSYGAGADAADATRGAGSGAGGRGRIKKPVRGRGAGRTAASGRLEAVSERRRRGATSSSLTDQAASEGDEQLSGRSLRQLAADLTAAQSEREEAAAGRKADELATDAERPDAARPLDGDEAQLDQATREFDAVSNPPAEQLDISQTAQTRSVSPVEESLVHLSESERHFAPGLRVPSDAIRARAPRPAAAEDEPTAVGSSAKQRKAQAGDLPDWFVAAKKRAAEKEAARRGSEHAAAPVARSQFADVPLGTDPVIPNSLTKTAARQKTEDKDALLRQALRADAAAEGVDAGAIDDQTPASALDAQAAPDAAASAVIADAAAQALASAAPGASDAADAASAKDSTPPSEALPAAPAAAKATPKKAPMPQSNASSSERPTLNADLSGLDQSAFSVINRAGGVDPAIVPASSLENSGRSQESEDSLQTQMPLVTDETEHRSLSSRLSAIPSLLTAESAVLPAQQPTLGEEFIPAADFLPAEDALVSKTGSFAALGATGTFAPVSDELLDYHQDDQDIYVDDADDFLPTEGYGSDESYAPVPQMTTMPESRARTFLGNLGDRLSGRKKREELEDSPASWLGVEDDFDARKAGGEIGSWDKFSDEEDDSWKGGAYGGASVEENRAALAAFSTELINREVWLVALGSQEAENSGIKALLAAHPSELRNATIINLDSVGAGKLCYTVREGAFRPRKTDHRLQSLATNAAAALDVHLDQASFVGYQTDAAAALSMGGRAISIIGLDAALPFAWRSKGDSMQILSEDSIQTASDLVFEMICNS